ncbi:MAG: DUF3015 family protein [bacterium]
MRILKYLSLSVLTLALTGVFAESVMAQEAKKKVKKKKKDTSGETSDTSGKSGGGYVPAYGPAGCGLGSIVMGPKPGFMQVFAATTNGCSGSQTFGITTGTSNCKDGPGGEASAQERKVFVEMNYAQLSKEASQGDGEMLEAFADILGCAESDDDLQAFQTLSQEKFASLFNDQSSDAVVDGYAAELRGHEKLSKNCVRLN